MNNRFTANVIDGNGDSGSGGGEYISDTTGTVESTNDRFVGNRIDDFVALGGGLFFEASSSGAQPFTARNLVAAGNELVFTEPPSRGISEVELRGGGLFLSGNGNGSEFRIEDSTIEDNTAIEGSGIYGESPQVSTLTRVEVPNPTETLVLANSIVFGETVSDDAIDGFAGRDVRSSDVCVGGAPHDDGDNAAPNSTSA